MNTAPHELDYSSKSRLRRVMSTVLLAYLLLMSYFLGFHYFSNLKQAETASLMRLNGIAYTLAMQIDGDAHQQLMARFGVKDAIQSASQDTQYQSIHQLLRRIAEANMLATPIYTIVLDSTNACFFGVTSAERPYFRHPYESAPALLMEKHAEGAMIPCYQDEFGTWLSAFAAVRNRRGEMVALVQADQQFDAFIIHARSEVLRDLAVGLVVGGVLLLVLVRVLQPILRQERRIKEALLAANVENKQVNEQLNKSLEQITALDQFRREMIANLSHDLRTPMASILGYLETVVHKKRQLSDAEQNKFLQVALSEANRLNRLVTDLFDLSKLESGQMKIDPEPFNIAELAQDVLQKYQLQAEEKHIKLLTDFSEVLPLAMADVRWMDRVLQNLMDNALRYAYEGGFVMFTIFYEDSTLHFKVCNSGDPILEAHLTRVFDRYFTSSNRKKDSSGLGLTLVKKVIELHGERVWAESNDSITTFRFTLPVFEPQTNEVPKVH